MGMLIKEITLCDYIQFIYGHAHKGGDFSVTIYTLHMGMLIKEKISL